MHLLPKCHLERNTELRRSRVLNVLIYHPEEVKSVEYVLTYGGILFASVQVLLYSDLCFSLVLRISAIC